MMWRHVFASAALCAAAGFAQARPFTAGNLVVSQVGNGSAALSSAATATFLQEFSPLGAPVSTTALPTAASGLNRQMTLSGTATSEGFLTLYRDSR